VKPVAARTGRRSVYRLLSDRPLHSIYFFIFRIIPNYYSPGYNRPAPRTAQDVPTILLSNALELFVFRRKCQRQALVGCLKQPKKKNCPCKPINKNVYFYLNWHIYLS
jgi:hypothetical protein